MQIPGLRGARDNLESLGNSSPHSNWNTWSSDPADQQIPGMTSEISVQNRTVLGNGKILAPRPLAETRE